MNDEKTIAAISTARGNGAIALIRLSGTEAIEIVGKVFVSPSGKALNMQATNTVHFGRIEFKGEILDEVMVSVFRNPHSYTGEDMAEISCHGSQYIQQNILQCLLESGARLAQPGEFTLRAFLNGKMDLSQAEAVADLVSSTSGASHKAAMNQMRGGFSSELTKLREQLVDFASLIELELDFSEEDVEFADRNRLTELINNIINSLSTLLESFQLGNVIKHGVPVAIIGETNVGKSTLLNSILNEERAIVSEIPGTTRDIIEDCIVVEGITFRFTDTAGLRATTDLIESLGIEKTYQKITHAMVILQIIDIRQSISSIKTNLLAIRENLTEDQYLIMVLNKKDTLTESEAVQKLLTVQAFCESEKEQAILISAKKKENLIELLKSLVKIVHADQFPEEGVIITNARHAEALNYAKEAAERVSKGLQTKLSNDFIAQDIREILYYLGLITGEVTTNEILENIFSKFCIGK